MITNDRRGNSTIFADELTNKQQITVVVPASVHPHLKFSNANLRYPDNGGVSDVEIILRSDFAPKGYTIRFEESLASFNKI